MIDKGGAGPAYSQPGSMGERCKLPHSRPVGWSGDGGVRESDKVELIKSGGWEQEGA